MSKLTHTRFSGRFALLASLILGFAFISGANASELSDSERAAVEQHFQILDQQQEASDNQTLDGFQADLDSQLEQAEEEFMEGACAEHELTFDSDSQVCY
ncbi:MULTISPECIES: hypothetical protein [Shewanella]|uniref:hypothetical protein n=1 Tax=Shewanella TaxID=22 RepID=UPI00118323E1|nr:MULTISPECIES: hypothetical protein [Shewanella]QYJ90447.1 hypothetical protein K0H81_02250 [Shewanella halotolerans]TVP15719.1 hypothetical protein AYI87_04430 [Shewanella sp. KCT]